MTSQDTTKNYGDITFLNHWAVVILITIMFTLGFISDYLPKGNSKENIILVHASIGIIACLVISWRIYWRIRNGFVFDSEISTFEKYLKILIYSLLLISIGLLIFSGPLYIWSEAKPLSFFNLFEIPSPFQIKNQPIHEFSEFVHKNTSYPFLIILISIHFCLVCRDIFSIKHSKKDLFSD